MKNIAGNMLELKIYHNLKMQIIKIFAANYQIYHLQPSSKSFISTCFCAFAVRQFVQILIKMKNES